MQHMRTLLQVIALALAVLPPLAGQTPAAPTRTMRVDYFHTGNSTQELFALDEVAIEPAPWPGPAGTIDDPIRYGAYGVDVRDAASQRVLFSAGFGSIYDEWVTTEEAKTATRTFHESVRFPAPAAPVTVSIRKRAAGDQWRDVWTTTVDPANMFVNTAPPEPNPGAVIAIERNGDSAKKVDLLLVGDGYTAAERGKFEADARRLVSVLFSTSPFKERRTDFNVWGLVPAARESGVSRPSQGLHRASPVGATYDAFGTERYVLTFNNKAFRGVASYAPYDVVEIVTNSRAYGGGGIYGLYSTVAADNAFSPYVFVHEFGHHFAALADEYLHLAGGLPAEWRAGGTVGAERHGDAGLAQVEGFGRAGHAAADTVAEGGVRAAVTRRADETRGDPQAGPARGRYGSALQGRSADGRAAVSVREVRRKDRRVRRRPLRSARPLSPGGGLHHVHAQRGVLRGLPSRHLARDRQPRALIPDP